MALCWQRGDVMKSWVRVEAEMTELRWRIFRA